MSDILFEPNNMDPLLAGFCDLMPGGYFISSGILAEKEEMVTNALLDLGFIIDDVLKDDEWCAVGAHYE